MADSAWTISSRLIAGLILYTAIGWLISLWVGHQAVLMAIGALFGLGLSYFLIFRGLRKDEITLDADAIRRERVRQQYRK
jgi:F0F1-type ATP synthase assembly protein I